MKTWYFKISGEGMPNEEITFPYGFYVNCILYTNKSLDQSKSMIFEDLKKDGLIKPKCDYLGAFEDFTWDETVFQRKMDKLSKEALKSPEVIHYDEFHIYELD